MVRGIKRIWRAYIVFVGLLVLCFGGAFFFLIIILFWSVGKDLVRWEKWLSVQAAKRLWVLPMTYDWTFNSD